MKFSCFDLLFIISLLILLVKLYLIKRDKIKECAIRHKLYHHTMVNSLKIAVVLILKALTVPVQ